MQYVILAALIVAGLVIGLDVIRQRRRRRERPHLHMALASHLGTVGSVDATEALVRALEDAGPPEPVDTAGGLWDVLEAIVDPEAFRPKLAAGTEITTFHLRWGEDYAMAASPDHATHYSIEPWEADLARSMDGSRSVGELIVEHLQEGGDLDPSAVLGLVDTLWSGGLLDPAPTDVMAAVGDGLDPSSSARRKLRRFGRELTHRLGRRGGVRHTRVSRRVALRVHTGRVRAARDRGAGRLGSVRRDGRVPSLRARAPAAAGGGRDLDRAGVHPHVLPRAGARAGADPLRPAGPVRGLLRLLRISGLLRGSNGRDDAGQGQAHPTVLRRALRRARAGGHRGGRSCSSHPALRSHRCCTGSRS